MACQYTDRIIVAIETDDASLAAAVDRYADFICRETLATQIVLGSLPGVTATELKIGAIRAKLYVQVVTT